METIEKDQLPNGWGPAVLVLKLVWSARASSVWKHRLELSTGVVVGYCYHKAADRSAVKRI